MLLLLEWFDLMCENKLLLSNLSDLLFLYIGDIFYGLINDYKYYPIEFIYSIALSEEFSIFFIDNLS